MFVFDKRRKTKLIIKFTFPKKASKIKTQLNIPTMLNSKQIHEKITKINSSLRAFAMSLTGNRVDADDLYQDTTLRIMSNADKFREGTNFKAWAVTIMRNIFINNYRKRMRRGVLLDQTPNNYYINSGEGSIENEGPTNSGYKELLDM